jgi:hypothetical protein
MDKLEHYTTLLHSKEDRYPEEEIQYNQDGSTGDGYDSHVMSWFFEKCEPAFYDDLPF